jgi:membrane protein
MGAALSYYTAFSLSPLLIIAIAVAGLLFGREAVEGYIVEQIGGLIGEETGRAIQTMIASSRRPAAGIIGSVVGVLTLAIGASGVFAELQDSLNTIWKVQPKAKGSGVLKIIRARFLSFAMVLTIGFLLLISLLVHAALAACGKFMGGLFPGTEALLHVINLVISFGVITLLFAMMFKMLPDVKIAWRHVWIGAGMTALLFTIGKFLIGLYLGKSGIASPYGAAGSLIVMLVWVYYSAQIFLFGAEFTHVYATRYGPRGKLGRQAAA